MALYNRTDLKASVTALITPGGALTASELDSKLGDICDSVIFADENLGKASVRVATTTNGTLATAFENGDTIDGVALATGNRILLKNQTTASENGVYTVNASGAPTRATDFDGSGDAVLGNSFYVREGTANAGKVFYLTGPTGTITIGSSSLVFNTSPISEATSLTPTIYWDAGDDFGVTYTSQTGYAHKQGNHVTFSIKIILSNKGSTGSSGLTVTGLPYAESGSYSHLPICLVAISSLDFGASDKQVFGEIYGGEIVVKFQTDNGAHNAVDKVDISNTSTIVVSGSYITG